MFEVNFILTKILTHKMIWTQSKTLYYNQIQKIKINIK